MLKLDRTEISLYDLLICLTNAADLISREVAYLAYRISEQMDLPLEQRKNLLLAGLLHDVGAFSLDERLALIEEEPQTSNSHAFRGARLLEGFAPLADAAEIIRYHHVPWNYGEGRWFDGEAVTGLSHILHLADRIAVSIDKNRHVIGQMDEIREKISGQRGALFTPESVDAFMAISTHEDLWLNATYRPLLYIPPNAALFDNVELNLDELINLTKIFANIIDFRNPFTATHTVGVAKTAEKLAQLAGFSESECKMMLVAGYLHDLGKLAVSKNILDKPGKLDSEERDAVRSHTFFTYRLLQTIKGFETINNWASFHHEKLNGEGYPFHLSGDAIPLGSRIVAVSDIFTALTEDRPYREGMSLEKSVAILKDMVAENAICPYIVSILTENLETIDEIRRNAQKESAVIYSSVVGS